ncbi:hypothetical protein ACP4OV_014722 [Aristida adscensionis]
MFIVSLLYKVGQISTYYLTRLARNGGNRISYGRQTHSRSIPPMMGEWVFFESLGYRIHWTHQRPLEDKVLAWSNGRPVIWNAGIGPAGSFVSTLSRLLFERSKDLYGPYDHIIRVRLTTPDVAAGSIEAQHRLAVEVLMEMASTLKILQPDDKLQELMQLAAEESYHGYGTISENLVLEAFGGQYIEKFGADPFGWSDPNYSLQPALSPILLRIGATCKQKRHMLLVENLQVPTLLNVLIFTMGLAARPSVSRLSRWLISTTSKVVCDKSRQLSARNFRYWDGYHLSPEYYNALPFDDLGERDWAMLIKEALWDAAGSIHEALQKQQDKGFWLHVALHCLYYAILYHPLQGAAGCQASSATVSSSSISSDELVRCWVAERLLFSTTSPFDILEINGKIQSSYRSAYEAGKVVIQALQKYSLLPVYSVSTRIGSTSRTVNTSTSSPQDDITGVSQLAMGVPRLDQDELYDHKKSCQLRWVSFFNDDGRHVSWDWRSRYSSPGVRAKFIPEKMTTSTLVLRGCSNIQGFPFHKVFGPHLHVLDLSYTTINSLPPLFSRLLNLYLLSLRGCSQLKTLSGQLQTSEKETLSGQLQTSEKEAPPLSHLGKLEALDMNGVPLLELTQQDGNNKSNLHYLDISGSRITTLPTQFFSGMASLEELILGNCPNLEELPPSLAELYNLLVLHVEGTQITSFPKDMFESLQRLHKLKLVNNKRLTSLPWSLSKAKGLKELHIYDCVRLMLESLWELVSGLEDLQIQAWKGLEDLKIHGHPNLKTISLSGAWIRCLSMRGCSRLKTVNFSDDLIALEDVDLSGTAIEELPHNLPNLPQLWKLLLLNVPCFKRFPWHQLVRFPKVFYLDHFASDDNKFLKKNCQRKICENENQQRQRTTNTAQVNINDSRMFHSFNADAANKLVIEGQFLQYFNVQVKPCGVSGKEPRNKKVELYTNIQRLSTYHDVHYDEATSIVPMLKLQPSQRHVEISAKSQYPNGLRHLLSVTHSIFITDDHFVRCLTDLNYSLMSLEVCQLHHCHQMTVVLRMNWKGSEALPSLQILLVSNLKNLLCFVEQTRPPYPRKIIITTLKLLKHIHLEDCPRLEKLFPYTLSLPMLEDLIVLFCPNLKTVFYEQPNSQVAPSPLPNIERIYLQELPQLQHIHEDAKFRFKMPKWQNLFVRGCQSFQRLPLLKEEYPKSKVKVSGERDWWDKLQMSLLERSHYSLVPPPKFASRRKNVIIKSFLR